MLTRPGIGLLSPTMARHKDRRRMGKDQLAIAVRKVFNAASVAESELLTSFLYVVHNQGRNLSTLICPFPQLTVVIDKKFRMRFEPPQTR